MNRMKKRVAQVLAGVVGLASVATAGVALAANGDRSGAAPGTGKAPVVFSTADRSGHDRHGESEPGDDNGQHQEPGDDNGQHQEPGDDDGQQGENEPGDDQGHHDQGEDHHGGNSGPGGDDGQHGDNSGPGGGD
jgi:hypothetical protein